MTLRTICLHGPESTGKSTMAPRLAGHFGTTCIAEFGRSYCEAFGTDLTMADLVMIAAAHDAKTRAATAAGRFPVILDTDPLMSAVWADMMFGRRDRWFNSWTNTADLYLLFDIDLPWQATAPACSARARRGGGSFRCAGPSWSDAACGGRSCAGRASGATSMRWRRSARWTESFGVGARRC